MDALSLKTLVKMQGISGREEYVRMYLYQYCVNKIGKENVHIDTMGNVIAFKKGTQPTAPTVMFVSHMDEVGLMVISATDDGLLCVRAIGGIDSRVLVSKRVTVGYGDNALPGVIGATAIHQQTAEDRKRALPIEQLYVDIGAKKKEEALNKAPAGTPITFDTQYTPFGNNLVVSRALDDRVGCYNNARLLDANNTADTYLVFSCQEEVGCRGAAGASFRIKPDVGIILESTAANDSGDIQEAQKVCRVGQGVAISFMDHASIAQPTMYRDMMKLAKEKGISHQTKMSVSGGNDGGVTQRSTIGVKTCVLSVPCRYIHSPSNVCSLSDVEAQYELAKAYIEQNWEDK